MSDPYADPLLDPEGYDPGEAAEEEYERREEELFRQFLWVVTEAQSLWGGLEALAHLHAMLKDERFKPEKRRKGGHDPGFDAALLAAHRGAKEGQKMAAVFELGREKKLSPETTERHLRRLLARERKISEGLARIRLEWRRIRDRQQEG